MSRGPDLLRRPRGAIALAPPELLDRLFAADLRAELDTILDVDGEVLTDLHTTEALARLAEVEVLLTGWGCDRIDDVVLDAAPKLRAIVHTGGSVAAHLGPEAGRRGIACSNAGAANATPVAEYTLAMILLANKAAFRAQREYRERRRAAGDATGRDAGTEVSALDLGDRVSAYPEVGNRDKIVGIVGASRIGRLVIDHLARFELEVVVADPFLSHGDAAGLGVRSVTLEELLATSDVVSLHAPALPTTVGMIGARELALLRDGATLINTARGVIVDQDALLAELTTGRIEAILDVTEPDVLPPDHPLFALPNVVVTPHIAGSLGTELHRLGEHAIDEIARFVTGRGFAYPEGG